MAFVELTLCRPITGGYPLDSLGRHPDRRLHITNKRHKRISFIDSSFVIPTIHSLPIEHDVKLNKTPINSTDFNFWNIIRINTKFISILPHLIESSDSQFELIYFFTW